MAKSSSKKQHILILIISSVVILSAILLFVLTSVLPSYLHGKRLEQNLATFTSPVYLPPQNDTSGVAFTTYLGWKDSYFVQAFANIKERTGANGYYQLAKKGLYAEASNGPSASDMQPFSEAMAMECKPHAAGIEICELGSPKLYIARRDVGEAFLLTDLTVRVVRSDQVESSQQTLYDYFPPTEQDIFSAADRLNNTKPVPINEAKKYFKPKSNIAL